MSLNSLKIATDGYLKRQAKAALIIAVAGYLNFTDSPPVPSGGGGGSIVGGGSSYVGEKYNDREKEADQILIEDSEIVAIVQLTLKHFII